MEENRWFNIGSRAEYLKVHQIISHECWSPDYISDPQWPVAIEPSAQVSPKASIENGSYVGELCAVEPDVVLENSILLPGSLVSQNSTLRSCIVGGIKVEPGTYEQTDFI